MSGKKKAIRAIQQPEGRAENSEVTALLCKDIFMQCENHSIYDE